jgi:hypothetical protein
MQRNAVELTTDEAWFLADVLGAGLYPWVLAVTCPYAAEAQRAEFDAAQRPAAVAKGYVGGGQTVDHRVAGWIKTVCYPRQGLDLRLFGQQDTLRGHIARSGSGEIVAAFRHAQMMTFTELDVFDFPGLVPTVVAGLDALAPQEPARFRSFTIPAEAGRRADEQVAKGADPQTVIEGIGAPARVTSLLAHALTQPRSFVEVIAHDNIDGRHTKTAVGVGVYNTAAGRIVITPSYEPDQPTRSTFSPGDPFAIAVALRDLTASLPSGAWFDTDITAFD